VGRSDTQASQALGTRTDWPRLRIKLLVIYLAVAITWIVASDAVVAYLAPSLAATTAMQTSKGIGFVLVTGGLVFLLLNRATADMRRLQHNLRILSDSTHDMEYWAGPDGTMLFISPACERITGYPPQVYLEDPELLWRIVHPDDLPVVHSHQTNGRPTPDDNEIEFRILHKDGRVRWLSHASRPVIDDDGLPHGRRGCNRDITARKLAELRVRDLEGHLQQQQKLETIGLLASSVAHDINNPLMGITSYATMLKEDLEIAGKPTTTVDEIIRETERIATLVRDGLTFCRDASSQSSDLDLHDILDGVRTLVRTLLRQDGITLVEDIPAGLPPIRCTGERIQQVLLNLIMNARDALNEKYNGRVPEKVITLKARVEENNGSSRVCLIVQDNGTGIPAAILPQLFEPFVSTKAPGKGTGLGLAICQRIVTDHHGQIKVESEPGEWTRFEVALPTSDS
jgi:PAS domain S-box-containing protein